MVNKWRTPGSWNGLVHQLCPNTGCNRSHKTADKTWCYSFDNKTRLLKMCFQRMDDNPEPWKRHQKADNWGQYVVTQHKCVCSNTGHIRFPTILFKDKLVCKLGVCSNQCQQVETKHNICQVHWHCQCCMLFSSFSEFDVKKNAENVTTNNQNWNKIKRCFHNGCWQQIVARLKPHFFCLANCLWRHTTTNSEILCLNDCCCQRCTTVNLDVSEWICVHWGCFEKMRKDVWRQSVQTIVGQIQWFQIQQPVKGFLLYKGDFIVSQTQCHQFKRSLKAISFNLWKAIKLNKQRIQLLSTHSVAYLFQEHSGQSKLDQVWKGSKCLPVPQIYLSEWKRQISTEECFHIDVCTSAWNC